MTNKSRLIHEQLFIGIDGGASNTTVAIVDQQGQSIYQQTFPVGANYHTIGLEAVIANLEMAVQEAIAELKVPPPLVFDQAVFGLAGNNFDHDHQVLEKAIKLSSLSSMIGQLTVVNDSLIALRAGVEDSVGIILLSGTGSNCLARSESGQIVQAGGLDYIMSDQGSGYDIGLRILRAVTSDLDGRSDATKLTKAVFKHLQVDTLNEMYQVIYRKYTDKASIASLAILASDVAEDGDHVAQHILNHSVNELLKMVDAVMTKLDWRDAKVSLVIIGSTILNSRYLYRRFEAELRRINPQTRIIKPTMSPAQAAATLALEAYRKPDPPKH